MWWKHHDLRSRFSPLKRGYFKGRSRTSPFPLGWFQPSSEKKWYLEITFWSHTKTSTFSQAKKTQQITSAKQKSTNQSAPVNDFVSIFCRVFSKRIFFVGTSSWPQEDQQIPDLLGTRSTVSKGCCVFCSANCPNIIKLDFRRLVYVVWVFLCCCLLLGFCCWSGGMLICLNFCFGLLFWLRYCSWCWILLEFWFC